ncbi:MAG: thermonuclease family protein [Patescibacteria group bacterium]
MGWILSIIGIGTAFVLGLYLRDAPDEPASKVAAIPETEITAYTNTAKYRWYRVVKVVDGDTLTILKDGENITLRLIGLDTPETVDPRKPVQCFGKEASEKAKRLLADTLVRIETDPSQGDLDKYGRTLAYTFLPDGTNFNMLMIAEGYGHEYTYNLPYKYQTEFKEAERKAREEERGLWAPSACSDLKSNAGTTSVISSNEQYECSRNLYNCSSFTAQAEAQSAFESCLPAEASAQAGGGADNDIHKLDSDGDGRVCESLP